MFKPKDEEPYGRLNPKVSKLHYARSSVNKDDSDNKMAAPEDELDHPVRKGLPYSQSEVRVDCSKRNLHS